MKLIKGMLIGAAAGYAYATRVPAEQRRNQLDQVVTTVKRRTGPVAEAVSANASALADTASRRATRAVDHAGDAAEDKLDGDPGGDTDDAGVNAVSPTST